MRKFIFATVALASLAAPLAAQAYPGEIRDDRRAVREEGRDLRDAYRSGDRSDIREERGEYRNARRELNEDLRDRRNDGYRNDGRYDRRYNYDGRRSEWRADRRYDAGRYYYPRGYNYRAWSVGGYVPRPYWGERYWVGRPVAYGLPYAARGLRWIRVGPDAVLIRQYNGSVVRVVRGIFY